MKNQSLNNPDPDNPQPINNPDPDNPQPINNPDPDNHPNPIKQTLHNPSFLGSFSGTLVLPFFGLLLLIIGHVANLITISSVFQPNEKIKTGWFITKVTGQGYTKYNKNNILNLFGLLSDDIGSSSKIRSMIYTDFPIRASDLKNGGGFDNLIDLSVLINKDQDFDYKKLRDLTENDKEKLNSQSLQARLVKAQKDQEVLCLAVTGYRDNKNSKYFNILDVKPIGTNQSRNYVNEYNKTTEIVKKHSYSDESVKTAYKTLKELTQSACEVEDDLNIITNAN